MATQVQRLQQIQAAAEAVLKLPPLERLHNLDDFTQANGPESVRMTPLQYAHMASFCGSKGGSLPKQRGELVYDRNYPIEEIAGFLGKVELGGVVSFTLYEYVKHIAETSGNSGLNYTLNGQPKVMNSGLSSGFMVMGKYASLAIEAMRKVEPNASRATIEGLLLTDGLHDLMAFANMDNNTNKKLEVLYGIRDGGAYSKEAAIEELELAEGLDYTISSDGNSLTLKNWEHASSGINSGSRCGALRHNSFPTIWQLVSTTTLAFHERKHNSNQPVATQEG